MTTLTLSPAWAPTRTQLLLGLLAVVLMFASGWADRSQAVPFTLQMVPVLVIGMLFTPRHAIMTVAATALLMAFTISAPRVAFTGGYMVGWVIAVGLMSWFIANVRDGSFTGREALWRYVAVGIGGYLVVWACGWFWLAYGTPQLGAKVAFLGGVAPFLLGAPLKLAVAVGLAYGIKRRWPQL